jgi:hypothetical protein
MIGLVARSNPNNSYRNAALLLELFHITDVR